MKQEHTHGIKAERRAVRHQKLKSAPRGSTRAGQIASTAVRRAYAGLPKGFKVKMRAL